MSSVSIRVLAPAICAFETVTDGHDTLGAITGGALHKQPQVSPTEAGISRWIVGWRESHIFLWESTSAIHGFSGQGAEMSAPFLCQALPDRGECGQLSRGNRCKRPRSRDVLEEFFACRHTDDRARNLRKAQCVSKGDIKVLRRHIAVA